MQPRLGPHLFQLKDLNSWVRVKSAKPGHEEQLLGEELDFVLMAEAARMKPNIWDEYIRHRLRSRGGCAAFVTSPKGRRNWINVLFERLRDHPQYAIYNFDANKNPGNAEKSIGSDEISEASLLEQGEGKPVAEFGDVYPDVRPRSTRRQRGRARLRAARERQVRRRRLRLPRPVCYRHGVNDGQGARRANVRRLGVREAQDTNKGSRQGAAHGLEAVSERARAVLRP